MSDTKISEAAVEAAESALSNKEGWPSDMQMRATLEAALPHLLQPAELAEQQGIVMSKDMTEAFANAPDHLFSKETAHKAFAGIGKQQVGESQGSND